MPNSKTIAQYLPMLRRYARALTGSQASGDAYVVASLEALVADPAIINPEGGPRVPLYRLFTKIWNSIAVNEVDTAPDHALPGERTLANITRLPRQAFLLVAMEGFDEADAARILDVDIASLRNLIEEVQPRARDRNRHRRADHRRRNLHRDGTRRADREHGASRHRCCPHAFGSHLAGKEKATGVDSCRYSVS